MSGSVQYSGFVVLLWLLLPLVRHLLQISEVYAARADARCWCFSSAVLLSCYQPALFNCCPPRTPAQESKDALAVLREIGATWGETAPSQNQGDFREVSRFFGMIPAGLKGVVPDDLQDVVSFLQILGVFPFSAVQCRLLLAGLPVAK